MKSIIIVTYFNFQLTVTTLNTVDRRRFMGTARSTKRYKLIVDRSYTCLLLGYCPVFLTQEKQTLEMLTAQRSDDRSETNPESRS